MAAKRSKKAAKKKAAKRRSRKPLSEQAIEIAERGRKKAGIGANPRVSTRRNGSFTPSVQADIIRQLAEHNSVVNACLANGVSYEGFRHLLRRDPEFAGKVALAQEQFTDRLREEARRRAVDGWQEPIYQGGELVGYKLKHSDTLLLALLKRYDKGFVDRLAVEAHHRHDPVRGAADMALAELTPEGREELKALLQREAERKAARAPGGNGKAPSKVVDAEVVR